MTAATRPGHEIDQLEVACKSIRHSIGRPVAGARGQRPEAAQASDEQHDASTSSCNRSAFIGTSRFQWELWFAGTALQSRLQARAAQRFTDATRWRDGERTKRRYIPEVCEW